MIRHCLTLVLLLSLAACARRKVSLPAQSPCLPPEASFIDLEPGWRLRAVFPLWKPGTTDHKLAAQKSDEKTRTVTLQANDNFVGYETQYYRIRKRWGAMQICFHSADVTKDGVSSSLDRPSQEVVKVPANTKRVRLVFLARASQADHNMAVIAANTDNVLNEATRKFEADPASCPHLDCYCAWIPAGVAIRAEMPVRTPSGIDWQPAR